MRIFSINPLRPLIAYRQMYPAPSIWARIKYKIADAIMDAHYKSNHEEYLKNLEINRKLVRKMLEK